MKSTLTCFLFRREMKQTPEDNCWSVPNEIQDNQIGLHHNNSHKKSYNFSQTKIGTCFYRIQFYSQWRQGADFSR